MPINNQDKIENALQNLKGFVDARLNKSASLSDSEKNNLFRRIVSGTPKRIPSPFVNSWEVFARQKMRYIAYAFPLILLGFFVNYSEALSMRFRAWVNDFNEVKSGLAVNQSTAEAKLSLSKAQKDISNLKSSSDAKRPILVAQVSSQSREVRNRVAALVNENQIIEAKEIALDLEAALKADELYKVSPEVQAEVLAATDLRVALEKKEVVQIALTDEANASSTVEKAETVQIKIDDLQKEVDGFEVNASSTDMITGAKEALEKAEAYLKENDIERAVLSLQAGERLVAELRLLLIK